MPGNPFKGDVFVPRSRSEDREGSIRGSSGLGQAVKLFPLGQVVATPGALAALEASGESLLGFLQRHLSGDWGEVDEHDARKNELSLEHGWRLLSYKPFQNTVLAS